MASRRVVLHADAGLQTGMGHLMRLLAVARVAAGRGWTVSVVGDIDNAGLEIARRAEPGLSVTTAGGRELERILLEAAGEASVIHLDSYAEIPDLRGRGALVSTMQDGPYGVRPADVTIDANLGAESTAVAPELSRVQLVGADLAVIREQVLVQRDAPRRDWGRPRVLVVMGGTDPRALTPRVITALDTIAEALDITVVDPRGRRDVRAAADASRHHVDVHGFVDDLPALARDHDLAVTASGTSVWDFACMGLPMALVCAVDNQVLGYRTVVERGLASGLGEPPHADLEERVAGLGPFLGAPSLLAKAGVRLRQEVDGLGTWRIVSAWEQLRDVAVVPVPDTGSLVVRHATLGDARLLFDWRDDLATRTASRSQDPLDWESHLAWLGRTLNDEKRLLLIVEEDGVPVATSRWDHHSGADWEISLTVAPALRGRGLAGRVLAASERALSAPRPVRRIAVVHEDNAASRRLFERAGYVPHLPVDERGFRTLASWSLHGQGGGVL